MTAPLLPARAVKGWWLGAALALTVGLLVTVFLGLRSQPEYTASTTSFVSMGPWSAAESDPFAASPFVLQRMDTYAGLATSPQVLQPVIDQLGLPLTVDALQARVSATSPPSTVLLTVAVRDTDATRASRIADAVAAQQARVIQRYEAAGEPPEQAPVLVTVVNRAVSRPDSSLFWYLATAVEVVAAVALVVAVVPLRRQRPQHASSKPAPPPQPFAHSPDTDGPALVDTKEPSPAPASPEREAEITRTP